MTSTEPIYESNSQEAGSNSRWTVKRHCWFLCIQYIVKLIRAINIKYKESLCMVGWCRCVVHRGSIGRSSVDLLGLSWVATCRGRRVNGLARVGHVSHKAIGMIGSVGDSLNPAVRKRNGVRTIHSTAGVLGLGSLEVGFGVVVRDAIREGVGLRGLLGIFQGQGHYRQLLPEHGRQLGQEHDRQEVWHGQEHGGRG